MALEIERKYVILIPDVRTLEKYPDYTSTDIVQTYLKSQAGITHRVRKRTYQSGAVYTETKKVRVDKISSEEKEREITEEEYVELLKKSDTGRVPIVKTRHSFTYLGQLFEIDIYPQWRHSCILETELKSRDTAVEFPPEVRAIAEVSGDKRFSNAQMAREFPRELI